MCAQRYNPGMTWTRLALLTGICLGASAQARIPIILDTDLGDSIDDALALAFALQSPELDVRAVTTVIDDVESKTRLAWKMLGVYNRRDIALAMGASEPLLDPVLSAPSKEFDVLTRNDIIPDAARRHAAGLIVETALQSRAKITIVAIGPLTNIALALKTDPRIKGNIERIVIMGGAYFSSETEYNVKRDRAAAEIVFRSGVPITAVGLDVTSQLKLREKDLDRMRLATTTFLTVSKSHHSLKEIVERHASVLDALQTRDPDAAERALRYHIEEPGKWLRAALEEEAAEVRKDSPKRRVSRRR